ncbi:hypothetical protein G7Y89_g5256 [Cudoniella acicularis]|uniref:Uncharacterized protein n=1 Tax=Cudoniella acicularis TaxID=354080 RepID=A0A8H4RNL8_9HELO|nr:hypothetical protein G7Y89_g5256 [Cudoniella acicularis]
MPSEHIQSQAAAQSQSQVRPSLGDRSSNSIQSYETDSPSTTPPHGKAKVQKHVVHSGRIHTRVPSTKGLHKLSKTHGNGPGNAHGNDGSHTDLKKLGRNSSATNLVKKNASHVTLKRNRSSADVPKRPKSSSSNGQGHKRLTSVHFEIGDQDDQWEEASSSASPALSRTVSRSGQSSAKLSANNSRPPSPSPPSPHKVESPAANGARNHTADAKIITERLLQRTPSHLATTTKMSLATATPKGHSPDSLGKAHSSTLNGNTLNNTPQIGSKEDVVSRFVGGSGTPSENSPFLNNSRRKSQDSKHGPEEVKRAQSMGNLTRHDSSAREDEDDEEKPTQMAPGVAINGLTGLHGGFGGTSLVGAGYDGKDPRIKLQLERTGLEYLVVRRHQDPIGLALKRLNQLPGAEKYRRIPPQNSRKAELAGSAGRYGLSQSVKESRSRTKDGKIPTGNGSYDGGGQSGGSQEDTGLSGVRDEDDSVSAILRSMWDKNFDFSTSAD